MSDPFTLQLQAFVDKARGNAEQVVRKVGIEMLRSVVLKSPVDTGRFRANWVVDFSGRGGLVPGVDKSGVRAISTGTNEILRFQLGGVLWMMNSLPYARRLEYGWSQQAPGGMVRITVAEFQGFIDQAVKALP